MAKGGAGREPDADAQSRLSVRPPVQGELATVEFGNSPGDGQSQSGASPESLVQADKATQGPFPLFEGDAWSLVANADGVTVTGGAQTA